MPWTTLDFSMHFWSSLSLMNHTLHLFPMCHLSKWEVRLSETDITNWTNWTMHRVSWNPVNCCITEPKIAFEKNCNRHMTPKVTLGHQKKRNGMNLYTCSLWYAVTTSLSCTALPVTLRSPSVSVKQLKSFTSHVCFPVRV